MKEIFRHFAEKTAWVCDNSELRRVRASSAGPTNRLHGFAWDRPCAAVKLLAR